MRIARRRTSTIEVGELRRIFSRFRPALSGLRWPMTGAFLLALVIPALELLKPWPITWVIDSLVEQDPASAPTKPLALFAAAAFCVPALLGAANERLQLLVARISRKATVRIRSEVYEHIHRLELGEHQRRFTGDLLMRLMGDVNMVRDLLFPSWLKLLSRGSVLIGAAIVFVIVDWRLLAVALAPLPFLTLNVKRTSARVKAAAGKQRRKEGAIAAQAAESIGRVGIIKAFSAEARTAHRFRSQARSAERATMAATRHAARLVRTTEVLTGIGTSLVLLVGALRVRTGALSPGELVLAVSYTRMLYKPIRTLSTEGTRLAKATACAGRVLDILELPSEQAETGEPTPPLVGAIEFHDVHHRYHDGRTSLEGLSARIPPRSFAAVTGENGAGKSTLLSLLLRLQTPMAGSITIGGRDITEFSLESYRDRFAFVPQQLALFSGTVRENIAFGNPESGGAAILAAAEQALLLPVLERLPDGLDTHLDEGGASLSGGEARRVMLARAALRRPSILLLDEPLVGLDPAARSIVIEAIRNIALGSGSPLGQTTTLVVHHGDIAELGADLHLHLDHHLSIGATR